MRKTICVRTYCFEGKEASRITAKNNFWGATTIFEGTRRRTTEMNITFCMGNRMPNTVFKFFPSKNLIQSDSNRKNWFWGHIFPLICGSIGPIDFKNNRAHPWANPHQPRVNFMKIGSKLQPVLRVLIHKYIRMINILTLRICNQGPPKRKTWPFPSPPLTPF